MKKIEDTVVVDVNDQLTKQKEIVDKGKADMDIAYDTAKRKTGTDTARLNESVVKSVLKLPINKIWDEIYQSVIGVHRKQLAGEQLTREQLANHNKGLEEFKDRIKLAVNFAKSYIIRMSQDSDGLDAEALSRMTDDANRKASNFVDLLNSGHHKELVKAYLYALGGAEEGKDLAQGRKAALETMQKYLAANKPNVRPYVWSVLSFMKKEDRKEIALNLYGTDPAKLNNFLDEGNKLGVYTWEEIDELNKSLKTGKTFAPEQIAQFQNNWKNMNDFRAAAEKLGFVAYGTNNQAGEKLNLVNVGLGFVQAGAIFTIFANFMTGAWQGGKFQGVGNAIKRLTNVQSLTAAAVFGGIEVLKSSKTLEQILSGSDPKAQAARDLQKEKHGNPQYPAWRAFFAQKDGARAFDEFIQYTKNRTKPPETDLAKVADLVTPTEFEKFLNGKIKSTDGKDINYAAIKDGFQKVNPKEIFTFAKIFDTLNIGGATAQVDFALWADDPAKKLSPDTKAVAKTEVKPAAKPAAKTDVKPTKANA